MHQALYRKYRPRSFDDVCGEDHVASVLRYQTEHGKVSHAYLFCGPRGTGKTSCAKILAKAVNCEHLDHGNPCGVCDACRSIDNGSAGDVLEMDAASNTGVDYIRDIRDEVSYVPSMLKRKVYIIDEVHMLSASAFNALLKTLEEPPEHVIFVLATTELHKLPATIISRCQRFDFRRIETDTIAARLLYIAEQEQIPLEPDAATILAKQSQGGMRDAISLFELCAGGGQNVTSDRVRDVLGLTGIEQVYKTAVAVSRGDVAGLFRIVDGVASSAKDIAVFWQELTAFWRDMLVEKHLGEKAQEYLDMTEPEMRVLHDGARRFSVPVLNVHFALLDEALQTMNRMPQTKRLTAEVTLIRMSDPKMCDTTDGLLARISALEEKVALLEAGGVVAMPEPDAAQPKPKPTPTVDSTPVAVPEPTTTPMSESTTAPTTDVYRPLPDISEVAERLSGMDSMAGAQLRTADCAIAEDGRTIRVRVASSFALQVLNEENTKAALQKAFCLSLGGLCRPGAAVVIEQGMVEDKRKHPVMDELSEI